VQYIAADDWININNKNKGVIYILRGVQSANC
jgi:hypothetical protein